MKLKRFFYAGRQISIAILILGVLFRLQHWFYTLPLTLLGAFGIAAFTIGLFIIKKSKGLRDYARTIVATTYVVNVAFRLMHWPFADVVQWIFYAAAAFWLIEEGLVYMGFSGSGGPKSKRDILASILAVFAAIMVIVGALFKLQHWPYGNVMLIIGLASAVIWLALESAIFRNKTAYLSKLTPLVWVALVCILAGICIKFLALPYSNILMLSGIGLITISLMKDIFKG